MNKKLKPTNTKKQELVFMFNFRTDLASERRDIFKKANSIENEINGMLIAIM